MRDLPGDQICDAGVLYPSAPCGLIRIQNALLDSSDSRLEDDAVN